MCDIHLAGEVPDYFIDLPFFCPTFTTSFRSIECIFLPFNCLKGEVFFISSSQIPRENFQ